MTVAPLSRRQVREVDRLAIEQFGVPGVVLMENAGRGCVEVMLRESGTVAEAVDLAAAYDGVDAFCLMHSDVRLTEAGIKAIRQRWDGPVGAYAHAAEPISPADYAAYEPVWLAAGATMVGGCCGIGPDHLAALATSIGRSVTGSGG